MCVAVTVKSGLLTVIELRVTFCPGQADSPLAGRTGWSVTVSVAVTKPVATVGWDKNIVTSSSSSSSQ